MGKSSETFNKKEKEKKRLKKQQDKKQRTEQRKANSDKGKTLDKMMAYLDENGNLTSIPPATKRPAGADISAIVISTPKKKDEPAEPNIGIISFFNTAKGFGFIRDENTRENVFFHVNELTFPAKENDRVQFETAKGPKGLTATQVKKR